MVFVFIEILFKMLLFKGDVLIYAEHCIHTHTHTHTYIHTYILMMDLFLTSSSRLLKTLIDGLDWFGLSF